MDPEMRALMLKALLQSESQQGMVPPETLRRLDDLNWQKNRVNDVMNSVARDYRAEEPDSFTRGLGRAVEKVRGRDMTKIEAQKNHTIGLWEQSQMDEAQKREQLLRLLFGP